MFPSLVEFYVLSFVALFTIVNPFSTAFIFAGLTGRASKIKKHLLAYRAAMVATTIFMVFLLLGNFILRFFGISIEAFKIAGGIIIFGIAMHMMWKQEPRFPHDKKIVTDQQISDDLAIVPIAFPFISGPGAIATVMILASQATSEIYVLPVVFAILSATLLCYLIMRNADIVVDYLGELGKRIATKILGLFLSVIAVQFVINGIMELLPQVISMLQ